MSGTMGRLVRQDGSASLVQVSRYSWKGCEIPGELPIGELVSVEFTDVALLVGEVRRSQLGTSHIMFTSVAG